MIIGFSSDFEIDGKYEIGRIKIFDTELSSKIINALFCVTDNWGEIDLRSKILNINWNLTNL